jgi:hypothetical protein
MVDPKPRPDLCTTALPDLAPVEELVVPRQAAPENERALRKDVGRSGPHG